MKRLLLLTLLLCPLAARTLDAMDDEPARHLALRPRHLAAIDPERSQPETPQVVTVRGFPKATVQRAEEEAERALGEAVGRWVDTCGLPAGWRPSREILASMTRQGPMEEIQKDYGQLYVRTIDLDVSPAQRDRLLLAFEREIASQRMLQLGAVLVFSLVCLGIVSTYIRTDEATKGYYTTALRVAATGTVLGAGVLLARALG